MIGLVRSEWIKFRSVRSTLVVLLMGALLVVLVAVLAARDAAGDGNTVQLTGLTGGVSAAVLLFGALGVQVIGQEYRFNTIRPTYSAEPRRVRVLAAKAVVVTVACAAVAMAMTAVCWLVGTAYMTGFEMDGVDQRAWLGIVVFTVGWSLLGLGVGAILRQPIAAILVLLGWAFVAENIIIGIESGWARWLPFANGFQMTMRMDSATSSDLRPVLSGGVYFFVVVAVVAAVGTLLAVRRDA